MSRKCSVPGCTKPHRARGMCSSHWAKWDRERKQKEAEALPPEPGEVRRSNGGGSMSLRAAREAERAEREKRKRKAKVNKPQPKPKAPTAEEQIYEKIEQLRRRLVSSPSLRLFCESQGVSPDEALTYNEVLHLAIERGVAALDKELA